MKKIPGGISETIPAVISKRFLGDICDGILVGISAELFEGISAGNPEKKFSKNYWRSSWKNFLRISLGFS